MPGWCHPSWSGEGINPCKHESGAASLPSPPEPFLKHLSTVFCQFKLNFPQESFLPLLTQTAFSASPWLHVQFVLWQFPPAGWLLCEVFFSSVAQAYLRWYGLNQVKASKSPFKSPSIFLDMLVWDAQNERWGVICNSPMWEGKAVWHAQGSTGAEEEWALGSEGWLLSIHVMEVTLGFIQPCIHLPLPSWRRFVLFT